MKSEKEKPREADPVWERVAAELERRGLKQQWLVEKLETTPQRVQNWTTRGLPGKAYADVATALDESADWLVGMAPPKWKQAKQEPSEREKLTPAAVTVGKIYDRMKPAQQDIFAKLLEAAFGADAQERPRELGHSDMMDLDLDLGEAEPQKGAGRGIGSR